MNVYVLKLSLNKWYVGITNDVQKRYNEHLFDNKCVWTSLYRPIKIEQIIPTDTNFDEDKYTKIYMNRYGIENVRGGSYVQKIISDEQKNVLEQEFRNVNQQCFRCGKAGHFVSQCVQHVYTTSPKRKVESSSQQQRKRCRSMFCSRCGRDSHNESDCYATFDIEGDVISDYDDSDESDDSDCYSDDSDC